MKILAVDTATVGCSAAIFVDDAIVAARSEDMERGQAEALIPMVAAVLAEAQPSCPHGFADLDLIAVTVGPGAFTGVRIGLAAARAMGIAAGVPVVGLTTLEVVAAAQNGCGLPLLIGLDTKRADVYVQLFDAKLAPLTAPAALLPAEIEGLLPDGDVALAGDAAPVLAQAIGGNGRNGRKIVTLAGPVRPEAAVVARLAAARWRAGPPPVDGPPPRPLYLRPPDATPPKARVR